MMRFRTSSKITASCNATAKAKSHIYSIGLLLNTSTYEVSLFQCLLKAFDDKNWYQFCLVVWCSGDIFETIKNCKRRFKLLHFGLVIQLDRLEELYREFHEDLAHRCIRYLQRKNDDLTRDNDNLTKLNELEYSTQRQSCVISRHNDNLTKLNDLEYSTQRQTCVISRQSTTKKDLAPAGLVALLHQLN